MKAQAILFDMDGTLADSEGVHHRALTDVLHHLGLAKPEGFDEAMTGRSMAFLHRSLVACVGLPLSEQAFALAKIDAFLRRASELRWRPGAQAAVEAVRRAGVRMAVVTNSDRLLLTPTLAALGLARPGLVTVSRNDVREGKPAPESYLRAAWLLGVAPADCVVVEDSVAGATAGLAAGMQVLAWPQVPTVFPAGARLVAASGLMPALAALVTTEESPFP